MYLFFCVRFREGLIRNWFNCIGISNWNWLELVISAVSFYFCWQWFLQYFLIENYRLGTVICKTTRFLDWGFLQPTLTNTLIVPWSVISCPQSLLTCFSVHTSQRNHDPTGWMCPVHLLRSRLASGPASKYWCDWKRGGQKQKKQLTAWVCESIRTY